MDIYFFFIVAPYPRLGGTFVLSNVFMGDKDHPTLQTENFIGRQSTL